MKIWLGQKWASEGLDDKQRTDADKTSTENEGEASKLTARERDGEKRKEGAVEDEGWKGVPGNGGGFVCRAVYGKHYLTYLFGVYVREGHRAKGFPPTADSQPACAVGT